MRKEEEGEKVINSVTELYRSNDRRLSVKLVSDFADRCRVISVRNPRLFLRNSSSVVLTRLSGPCS
jgi:hypothetical protein